MVLLVLGFFSILLITFALVVVMTRQSPLEKSVDQRLASIQAFSGNAAGAVPQTAQLLKITRSSRFGRLEEILERYQFSQKLQRLILQAHSSTTASALILTSLVLAIAGYALVSFFAPILLVDIISAAVLGWLPYGILSFKRSRRVKAFDAVLAEAIDMMGRALRAGHSTVGAIEMLAQNSQEPANQEFGEVFEQQNLGLPLRDTLLQLLERVPSADLRVLVTAILVQKDTGGNLAEVLDRTAFVIRERLRIQGEIRIHTAQGRLTGWILTLLPVVLLLVINILNPGYSHVLLYGPLGRKLIYLSVGLLATGSALIHRIVNGIEA
jgi:tight adherence protein B